MTSQRRVSPWPRPKSRCVKMPGNTLHRSHERRVNVWTCSHVNFCEYTCNRSTCRRSGSLIGESVSRRSIGVFWWVRTTERQIDCVAWRTAGNCRRIAKRRAWSSSNFGSPCSDDRWWWTVAYERIREGNDVKKRCTERKRKGTC